MNLDLDILTEETKEDLTQRGIIGPASPEFISWMEAKGIPADLVQALTRISPKKEIWAGAGSIFPERDIMKFNDEFPQALASQLFYVGCAGNSDPIAIDLGQGERGWSNRIHRS
jgi:hypothetical protein